MHSTARSPHRQADRQTHNSARAAHALCQPHTDTHTMAQRTCSMRIMACSAVGMLSIPPGHLLTILLWILRPYDLCTSLHSSAIALAALSHSRSLPHQLSEESTLHSQSLSCLVFRFRLCLSTSLSVSLFPPPSLRDRPGATRRLRAADMCGQILFLSLCLSLPISPCLSASPSPLSRSLPLCTYVLRIAGMCGRIASASTSRCGLIAT